MTIEHVVKYPIGERKERPLLLVHGAGRSTAYYEWWMDDFATHGYETHAISFPGHGQSGLTRPIHLHSINDYVQTLTTIIDQINPPIVIAHSMGGYALQLYLQKHDLPAAVLLASVPHSGVFRSCWRAMSVVPFVYIRRFLKLNESNDVPTVVKSLLVRSTTYTPKEIRKRLGSESILAGINLLLPIRRKPANTPILVIAAEQDHLFSVQEQKETATFHNADFLLIEGQGHDLMIECNWQHTASLIRDWFERADKGI